MPGKAGRSGRRAMPAEKRKRNNLTFRTRDDLKRLLEVGAEKAGRSLSEEIEVRLERSFQQEADSGGRELQGLLRQMVGAAEIIQERTGKTAFDDWRTGLAVRRAWKQLMLGQLCPPPDEMIAELERLSDAVPDKPERPVAPPRGGLLVRSATDEEWEAWREGEQNFEKDLKTFMIAFDEHEAEVRKIQDEVKKAVGIGEEAFRLQIDQEK